jgi:hypothetical protein
LWNDFEFIAAHEIQHILLAPTKLNSEAHARPPLLTDRQKRAWRISFERSHHKCYLAARKALERAMAIAPAEIAEIKQRQQYYRTHDIDAHDIQPDYSFTIALLPEEKKIALYIAVLCNPGYYAKYPADKRVLEMACNFRGLIHKFGKEKMRAIAGEFIEYVDAQINRHYLQPVGYGHSF